MSLPEDLRRQAWHLATREPRRPLQASLRRAVSAGYYALFHLLIDEATVQMLGRGRHRQGFRHIVARAFDHRPMAAACKSNRSGTLPIHVSAALGGAPIPTDLQNVAAAFADLQEARHRADYNLAQPFSRGEVRLLLQQLDAAFQAWEQVRGQEITRFFLITLALWDKLKK